MKIAFVYDRVNKIGGAERVLSQLHSLFPDAPFYTAFYDRSKAGWAGDWDVRTGFLSRIPGVASHHELFPWLTPMAFESFSFDGYDAVISVTSAEAKSVITKPETCHICYCLTPTRYLWSGVREYAESPAVGVAAPIVGYAYHRLLPTLRRWDLVASSRPDAYVAISDLVAGRIAEYYRRKTAAVVYPPVDTDRFVPGRSPTGDYYLTVARLVPYKRVDVVAQACSTLGRRLVIIGRGHDEARIRRVSGRTVEIVRDELTDRKLLEYYQNCRAFLYAGSEDFGIAAAEAQSCGRPVVAYGNSGIAEIVRDGETGMLFGSQDPDGMAKAILAFEAMSVSVEAARKNALRFAPGVFREAMRRVIVQTVRSYKEENA
jgi:glycosyltransferase involved in cell wall biosynthesis